MSVRDTTGHPAAGGDDHEPRLLVADVIDRTVTGIGHVIGWANALLILVIIFNVVLRYGFGKGHPAIEELQWHLYALAVMMGVSYAQVTDSHVRVDVVATRLSERTIRFWEIFGILVFVFPFVYVVFWHSLDFVAESYRLNESSDAPLGLPWRWAIKAVIPISFGLLGLAALSRLLRDVAYLMRRT